MVDTTAYTCPQCNATLAFNPDTEMLYCEWCGGSFTVSQIEDSLNEHSSSRKKSEARAEKRDADAKANNREALSSSSTSGPTSDAAAGIAAAAGTVNTPTPDSSPATATSTSNSPADKAAAVAAILNEEEPAHAKFTVSGRRRIEERKKEAARVAMDGIAQKSIDEWESVHQSDADAFFNEMQGYTCRNCGAQVIADKLTVATSCQYCGSNVVADDRVNGSFKPAALIPFKIKASDVPAHLAEFYKDRPLLPKDFFTKNKVGEVQGLYVPFWLYDSTVSGSASYLAEDSKCYQEGDYDVTETSSYDCEREGTVDFQFVPVDASKRIDNDLMDSIEPYDFTQMRTFQPAYLTGFVAERFDESPRSELEIAKSRMINSAKNLFKSSVKHQSVIEKWTPSFAVNNPMAAYVMLPVYLFNCKYAGRSYRYAINGQTGKVVGEVPIGKKECLMAFLKATLKRFGIGVILAVILGILLSLGIL